MKNLARDVLEEFALHTHRAHERYAAVVAATSPYARLLRYCERYGLGRLCLNVPGDVIREAHRVGRSPSELLALAWRRARPQIKALPTMVPP